MAKIKILNKKRLRIGVLIFLIVLSISIFSIEFYLNHEKVLEVREIPAKLEIGDRIGLDTNASFLNFGIIKPGSIITKKISIKNEYSFPIKVTLKPEGEIKDFLVSESPRIIQIGGDGVMTVSATIPAGVSEGNYFGKVVVIIEKSMKNYGG